MQVRRALDRPLSAWGYEVETVGDGSRPWRPPIPVLAGLGVCRAGQVVGPILVFSVRADEAEKVEALDLGPDDQLSRRFRATPDDISVDRL